MKYFNFFVVIIFWTLQVESYHGVFNLYSIDILYIYLVSVTTDVHAW